jgi:D-alanine-D-alanine ligase
VDNSIPNSPGGPEPQWLLWPRLSERLAQTDVVVLGGGSSDEREVSLRSAASVASALSQLENDQHRVHPRSIQDVEIDARGRWNLEGQNYDPSSALDRFPPGALFLLALHGGEGEDGRLQQVLLERGFAFTGSGPQASALCMDKARSRIRAQDVGLTVAPGLLVERAAWDSDPEHVHRKVESLGPGPWFVKPNCGGSSLGIVRAERPSQVKDGIAAILGTGQAALVENEIVGLEVSVGILGGGKATAHALPLCEILPGPGRFFDYEEKYNDSGAREFCPPEHTPPQLATEVQAMACAAFHGLGCQGYGRIDFILPHDGGPGVFLEANTLPGMTKRSLLPRAALAANMNFGSLCLEILAHGLTSSLARLHE